MVPIAENRQGGGPNCILGVRLPKGFGGPRVFGLKIESHGFGLYRASGSGVSPNRIQGVGLTIQSTGHRVWEVRGSEGSEL